MKIIIVFACIFSFPCIALSQQPYPIPKVGLTLSGGGAKGLAHIGILKAIDSAGLKIDFITGTSMGAVIGALYAVGYTGKEIEAMSRKLDWDILLSNQIPLRSLSMEEKKEYARFALELPFINNKIKLPSGVIQGQELNIKFLELFFNAFDKQKFSDLPIPFQCMATDLETGQLVVLDTGNLVTALRASMAIPSIFSSITIGGRKLVDGGLVRNFPVKNLKEMGANITIGSNVSGGLSAKDLNNPLDVILQMALFKEADDFIDEIPLTNLYIHMPLVKYNMGSFGSSNEIMKAGIDSGKRFYGQFKKLADSIHSIIGQPTGFNRSSFSRSVYVNDYSVMGLEKTSAPFFMHMMDFYDHKRYTATEISKSIRRAYGSRYYRSITYSFEVIDIDTVNIIFHVEENPTTYIKAGVYYSIFRGINVNLNITRRDFILPNSRSMLSVAIGESMQLQAEHLQYLGRRKNLAVIPGFNIDRLSINTYNNYKKEGAFRQTFYKAYAHFQNSSHTKFVAGTGASWEYVSYNPILRSSKEQRGGLSNLNAYVYLNYNSLKQTFFPTSGIKLNAELGFIFNQQSNIKFYENGQQVNPVNNNLDNYARFALDGSFYIPLHSRLTFLSQFQTGINFTDNANPLNNFYVGGLSGNFRNQVMFAGLQEATVSSPTVAALQIGLRVTLYNNLYLIGRANGLVKDFATNKYATSNTNFLSGYALTFAYKSPIGPLELSAMYSDQSKKIQSYVTFGIPF